MCTELGNDDYMTAYVEEAGKTTLCAAATGSGCSEREQEFIAKMKASSAAALPQQLARLQGMNGASMKPELLDWLNRRVKVLKQLVDVAPAAEATGEL